MAAFISVLIERSHQRLVGFVLWLVPFVLILALAGTFAVHQVREGMTAADVAPLLEPPRST